MRRRHPRIACRPSKSFFYLALLSSPLHTNCSEVVGAAPSRHGEGIQKPACQTRSGSGPPFPFRGGAGGGGSHARGRPPPGLAPLGHPPPADAGRGIRRPVRRMATALVPLSLQGGGVRGGGRAPVTTSPAKHALRKRIEMGIACSGKSKIGEVCSPRICYSACCLSSPGLAQSSGHALCFSVLPPDR
jgi:hypothetical protein